MDFDEDILVVTPPSKQPEPDAQFWDGYPQNLFQNWTESQVKRCEMLTACPVGESNVFKVDVFRDGTFGHAGPYIATIKDKPSEAAFWDLLHEPVSPLVSCFVRIDEVMFAEGREYSCASPLRSEYDQRSSENVGDEVRPSFLSLHNIQLLCRYNIEPFFFSSSTNWIPSRYRENLIQNQSDREQSYISVTFVLRDSEMLQTSLSSFHSFVWSIERLQAQSRHTCIQKNQVLRHHRRKACVFEFLFLTLLICV